jgi:hypothetical protein
MATFWGFVTSICMEATMKYRDNISGVEYLFYSDSNLGVMAL